MLADTHTSASEALHEPKSPCISVTGIGLRQEMKE